MLMASSNLCLRYLECASIKSIDILKIYIRLGWNIRMPTDDTY